MQTKDFTGRPIVVGTDGTALSRATVRDAAELARMDGVPLHIVGCYDHVDDVNHRMARVNAPRDVCHDISGRGDAFADAHDARRIVEHLDLDVHVHVGAGPLNHAVAVVARRVNGGMVLQQRRSGRFTRVLKAFQRDNGGNVPVIALDERLRAS